MQFESLTDEEYKRIPDFLNWLCNKIYLYLCRSVNRKKIRLRLNYLKKVNWINWIDNKDISVNEIMLAIKNSLKVSRKKTIWEISFNDNVMIPHTRTPITRLIRFLDYGDNKVHGTGMIQYIKRRFSVIQLNKWWIAYIILKTNGYTKGRIISDF